MITKERNRAIMDNKGIFEKLKITFIKCKESIKETYNKKKKAFIGGCASLLTIIMLVSIFSMQFQINKTDILNINSAKQLASTSKYVIYNLNDEELPVTDSEGNEILTKQSINGKEYYTVETNDRGDITKDLSKGVYKIVKINQVENRYELGDEKSFIQVLDNNEVSEIEVQEFNITNTYIGPEITSTKTYKTEHDEAFVVEGEKIKYTITVENSGKMAKNVVIKDTIPDGTSFVPGSITIKPQPTEVPEGGYTDTNLSQGISVEVPAIEESEIEGVKGKKGKVTITFEVTVNQLEKGKYSKEINNTAIVDGEPTETIKVMVNKEVPVQLDEIEVTNTYIGPVISEDKSLSTEHGEEYVTEEEKITYSITVENSGEIAKNVVIKDTIPAGTSFETGSIRIDDQETYVINGETKNTNTLTDVNLQDGIEVNVPGSKAVGDDGTRENGKVTLTFVVKVNKLADGEYTKSIINQAFVDDVPTREVTIIVNKNIEGKKKDLVLNKRDSLTKEGLGKAKFTLDPLVTKLTGSMEQVEINPSIKVEKTVINTPKNGIAYALGEKIRYSVTVTNTGNVGLKDVRIVDELQKIESITSTLIATFEEPNIFTLVKDLLPGEKRTISLAYKVTEEDILNGNVTNKVNVTAKTLTPEEYEVTGSTEVVTKLDELEGRLKLSKKVTNTPKDGSAYKLGETIVYEITIVNEGNVAVKGITVIDDLVGKTEETGWRIQLLKPGESVTHTCRYVVQEKDLIAGGVTNVVTAKATGTASSDPTKQKVTVQEAQVESDVEEAKSSLEVEKIVTNSPTNRAGFALGEDINYKIVVRNTGNITINNIKVTDPLTNGNWDIATLKPQEKSEEFLTTYTVKEQDIINEGVNNTVTATGTDINNQTVTNSSTANAGVEYKNPHLTVTKKVTSNPDNGKTYSLGETIQFEITVVNDGNLTIKDVEVSD